MTARGNSVAGWVGVLGAGAAIAARKMGDFDLPWHLATGRYLVETGVPARDPFSFLHRPMGAIEIASDSGLYLVWKALGALGLQLGLAAIVVAIGAVLYRTMRHHGALAWLGVGAALAAMNAWLLVRPATVGFLLTALLAAGIEAHRRSPRTRRGRLALASAVPMALLWANSHGSVTLGIALVGAYAVYRAACLAARGRLGGLFPSHDGKDAAFAAAVAAAAALTTGANLAGFAILGGARTAEAASMYAEWSAATPKFLFVTEPATGVLLVIAACALLFGRNDAGSRVPSAWDAGLILLGFAMSLVAVRLIAFAAVLLSVVSVRRLAPVVVDTSRLRALCFASVLLVGPLMLARHYTSLGVGFEPSHFPQGAVAYARAARPEGRMWNFLPFGGYLIWRLYPEQLVFVDGRTSWVHDIDTLRRAHASNQEDAAFAALAAEYQMEWAITPSREGTPYGAPIARSPAWVMVYFDDVGAVYVRRDGPNRQLAEAGYRVFRHRVQPGALLELALAGRRTADLVHDGELALGQAPRSPRAAFLAACGALAARDRAQFDAARARLASLVGGGHASLDLLDAAWRRAVPGL